MLLNIDIPTASCRDTSLDYRAVAMTRNLV